MRTLAIALIEKDNPSSAALVIGLFVLGLVVLTVVGVFVSRQRDRGRSQRRQRWGLKHGLVLLDPADGRTRSSGAEADIRRTVLDLYPGFGLSEAENAQARHILEGAVAGFQVRVFDYRCSYSTPGSTESIVTDYGIVAIDLPASAGTISLQSRRFRDQVDPSDEIQFPREAFQKRFHVFRDDLSDLAARMDESLERLLIESPIYSLTVHDRTLIAKAVNLLNDEGYERLLQASLGLAKLVCKS